MHREQDVIDAAVSAAEDVIFERYSRSEVADIDVTVHVRDADVEIDVYVSIPSADDEGEIADQAALAGQTAVDKVMDESGLE